MIRAIIIDDIPLAISSLKADIEDYHPEVKIIGTAESVVEASKLIQKEKPDLLFLDINMGDGDGFDLIDIINDPEIKIIFTTASEAYAIKAFQYDAVDYLLKPIDSELLKKAILKAVAKPVSENVDFLPPPTGNSGKLVLNTQDEVRTVKIDEIVRLEAMGNYTYFFFTDNSKVLVTKTLKEYDKILPDLIFLRVHQSHLVNMNFIKSYVKTEGGFLLMKDGAEVPVSVRKKTYVIDRLSK